MQVSATTMAATLRILFSTNALTNATAITMGMRPQPKRANLPMELPDPSNKVSNIMFKTGASFFCSTFR